MAETWKTTRRCPECLRNNKLNYLNNQEWGKNGDGKQEYRMTCPECGHVEMGLWRGQWRNHEEKI